MSTEKTFRKGDIVLPKLRGELGEPQPHTVWWVRGTHGVRGTHAAIRNWAGEIDIVETCTLRPALPVLLLRHLRAAASGGATAQQAHRWLTKDLRLEVSQTRVRAELEALVKAGKAYRRQRTVYTQSIRQSWTRLATPHAKHLYFIKES